MSRPNQRSPFLQLPQEREGEWVPLSYVLVLGIAQYINRVLELSRLADEIENQVGYHSGRVLN